jgi:hypothetical protein
MRTFAAAAALLLALSPSAWADYRESYRKGLEAMEKGKWPDTLRHMREAVAEQPFEGERIKVYGVRFEDYLPHFYVGLALFNARDCAGALKAWETSEGQGKVKKTQQYKTLVKEKQTCETRLAQERSKEPAPPRPAGPDPAAVAAAIQRVEGQLQGTADTARTLAALARDPALAGAWAEDPSLGGAEREASALVAAARSKLEAGRRESDLATVNQAGELASRAILQLEAVRQVATVRREAARAANQNLSPPKKPADDSTKPVSPAGRESAPPTELVTAAFLFFSGQYQAAVNVLDAQPRPAGRAGAQGLLLRAAARHALYVMGGEKNTALLEAAQADVASCRQMDPRFAPHPRFFSPRFRDFFLAAR